MIKDILTACILFVCVSLSWLAEKVGFDKAQDQQLAYELGIWSAILILALVIVTEVKGNRVYIWLIGVVTAGMNIPNLIFKDLKLDLGHIVLAYTFAFTLVFLIRKYRKFKVR